jgi:tetratricopeptide (TPR) repeat protein
MTGAERLTATLRISQSEVAFTAQGRSYTQPTGGLTLAARELLRQVTAPDAYRRPDDPGSAPTADDPSDALRKAGQALGKSFLEGPAGLALARHLTAGDATGTVVRLAVEATGDLADLPWEIIILPELCDPSPDRPPLGLDPRVAMCRVAANHAQQPYEAQVPPGPFGIVAVIGCPERAGMVLLNYERELNTILNAVSPEGQAPLADVRVLNWGTAAAIGRALAARPTHVLHISCHAEPGYLALETTTGDEDLVDAGRFLTEVIPARSSVPPLIVLAGCSTSQAVRGDSGSALPGLARSLVAAGVPAVIAMTADVSDEYATLFAGALYGLLASSPEADIVAAVALVRRLLAEDEESPRSLPQWHIPTIFVRDPLEARAGEVMAPGTARRKSPTGDHPAHFVGRRAELRDVTSALRSGGTGIVVCGMGGAGKTAFLAETIALLDGAAGIAVHIEANQSPEQALAAVTGAAGASVDIAGLRWPDALTLVRQQLLTNQRVLLVFDASITDLIPYNGGHLLGNLELAVFLAAWTASVPGGSFLAASPHPFRLPGGPGTQPETRFLGFLTEAEARKLTLQLPAVQAARAAQTDNETVFSHQLSRLSGHPAALIRLNSLLEADPQRELADAVTDVASATVAATGLAGLMAELDGDDPLRKLVTAASVYRLPVSRVGMNWQLADSLDPAGDPQRLSRLGRAVSDPATGTGLSPQLRNDLAEERRPADNARLDDAIRRGMALGLITGPFDPGREPEARFQVPGLIAERVQAGAAPAVMIEANRRAAAYWHWLDETAGPDSVDLAATWWLEEALYHLVQSGKATSSLEVATELLSSAILLGESGLGLAHGLGTLIAHIAPDPSRELLGARMALGNAYAMLGRVDESMSELSAGISTARALGDDVLTVAAASSLVVMLAGTGQAALVHAAVTESAAAEAAERAGDDVLRAVVRLMHAHAAVMSSDMDTGIALASEALALLDGPTAGDLLVHAGHDLDRALIAEVLSQSSAATAARGEAAGKLDRGLLALDAKFRAHFLIAAAAVTLARLDQADRHADSALELARAFPYAGFRGRACLAKGMILVARSELMTAETMLRSALLDPTTARSGMEALCYAALGDVAERQGDTATAAERLEKAIAAARLCGNALHEGIYCGMRAMLSLIREDGREKEWLARAQASGAGDHPMVRATATLTAAQRKFLREEDYPASMQLARQAIAESRAAGLQQLVLLALRALVSAAIAAEDEDAFEQAATELEAETENAGDPLAALLWLVVKAEVGMLLASSEEEWAEVAEIVREALGTAEEIGAYEVAAICHQNLMTISLKLKEYGELTDVAEKLLIVSRIVDDPNGILMSIEGAILAALADEDLTTAREQIQWHHAYADGTAAEFSSMLLEGMLSAAEGRLDLAETAWRQSLTMAESMEQPAQIALALDLLADAAEERGDLPSTQDHLTRQLTLLAPDEHTDRLRALLKLREVSLRRSAEEPDHPWSQALLQLAESTPDWRLKANCYQLLGETAADKGQARLAESCLRQSIDLWEDDGEDWILSLGRKAARRSLARMLARDPHQLTEAVMLTARNIAESVRDDDIYPLDTFLLQILRDGMPNDQFDTTLLTFDPAERAAILGELGC